MQITENCIINAMPEDAYHADPCPTPSLSSSMANNLLTLTEEEAMLQSKRLNPEYEDRKTDAMDLGNAAHSFILLGERGTYEQAPFDAWRSNAAKAAKADIEARGLIALNDTTGPKFIEGINGMKAALVKQLAAHKDYPGLMMKGKGEQSAFSCTAGMWSRARFDWLDENYTDVIVDYKTTGVSFESWEKNQLWSEGKFIQSPHYRHVYDTITGRKSKFVWVVQQVKKPWHVRLFEIDDSFSEEVESRYLIARQKFKHCLEINVWRGQPPYTFHSCPPAWTVQGWEVEQLNRDVLKSRIAEEQTEVAEQPVNTQAAG